MIQPLGLFCKRLTKQMLVLRRVEMRLELSRTHFYILILGISILTPLFSFKSYYLHET